MASVRGPTLSEIELRYPFAPASRGFFESIPIEDSLNSTEVVQQAMSRLLNALGRGEYRPHMSELIEFSSFFAAVFVASQDSYIATKLAKKESERSKAFFAAERPQGKIDAFRECFGVAVDGGNGGDNSRFQFPVEVYLSLVTKYELVKSEDWRLSRQPLTNGTVYLNDNSLNDLFCDCSRSAIREGATRLRKGVFPRQLQDVRARVMEYVPVQRPRTGKGYDYVEELLKHPTSDGRHRFVWLVLAPYLVNVKRLGNDEAIEKIRGFVSVAGETGDLRRFVEYNVRRAQRNGLLPPTLAKLRTEHPDLYGLLPKEVTSEPFARSQGRPRDASGRHP